MTNAANDEFYDDDDIPFSSGDEQAIIDYLLSLPPSVRELVAWRVMMHGVPKER